MSEYDFRLNCSNCGRWTIPNHKPGDPSHILRCDDCGKKHSEDSVFFIDLDRTWQRDESGALVEDPA